MSTELDLRAFNIASAVVEEGSMSGAALRLGLTQSAVSQAVRRAEASLGTALVHRGHRPLRPTEAGRVLATEIRDVTLQIQSALERIRRAALQPDRLDLRLGMIDTFAATAGPKLVQELMEGAMALRLTVHSGLAVAHTDALIHHVLDAVIVTADSVESLEGVDSVPLFSEPYVLIGPSAWQGRLHGLALSEILSQHRLIRYSARSHMGLQVERHLRRMRLEAPSVLSFDTSDALVAMVASGVGVAIVTPLGLLQARVHRPQLWIGQLPGPRVSRELVLATRRNEFGELGPRIAEAARVIFCDCTLPELVTMIPWLREDSNCVVRHASSQATETS